MPPKKKDTNTLDLFDWQPPEPVVKEFDPERVKGYRLSNLLARRIAEVLNDTKTSRAEIVEKMREYLGPELARNLSENILNAWASEAREDQAPSAIRLQALLYVTKDIRLLNFIAEPQGWAVIDRKYLPAIHEAMISDELEQIEKEKQLLEQKRRKARHGWKGDRS